MYSIVSIILLYTSLFIIITVVQFLFVNPKYFVMEYSRFSMIFPNALYQEIYYKRWVCYDILSEV